MDRTAPAPAAPLLDHANPTARRVDAALVASEHRGMSVAAVARRVSLPRDDAARLLDRLVASGHAERIGTGPWTRYRATD